MLSNKIMRPVSFMLIIIYFASCTTTYEVTRRSELLIPDDLGELTVTTRDNKEYTMKHYRLEDSVLVYSGSVLTGKYDIPSSGTLKLSDIRKIEAYEGSLGRTILIVGAAAAVIITFCAFLNHESGMKNDVVIQYPGGGSCGGVSSRFSPADLDKPIAAGFGSIIDENLRPEEKMYLDIINNVATYHFTVNSKARVLEIESLNEPSGNADSIDLITIDIGNSK